MNFLAVDTSENYMTVIAYANGVSETRFVPDCTRSHSVQLMEEIDLALKSVSLTPAACDFFAVAVGPGSFTGIRIGIACVKGLCLATGKQALAVTSFDTLAYAEKGGLLAVIDAGHDNVYACGYDEEKNVTVAPAFLSVQEAEGLGLRTVAPEQTNPARGLLNAVLAKKEQLCRAEELSALYLRKSSAEVNAG